jgi:hypothetical protein
MLGIHPTLQSPAAQAEVAVLGALALWLSGRRQQPAEAA